jgi:hypothetical protein
VLFFSLGNFYFSWRIEGHFNKINTLSLLLALTYTIIVLVFPQTAERVFCNLKRTYQTDSYSNCLELGKFTKTYWSCNPATMLTE